MLQAERSQFLLPMKLLGFFSWPNPSGRTAVLEFTRPLKELGSKARPTRMVDNFIPIYERIQYNNVEASMSHNPIGLHGLMQGLF
jgi:hypothetical protein